MYEPTQPGPARALGAPHPTHPPHSPHPPPPRPRPRPTLAMRRLWILAALGALLAAGGFAIFQDRHRRAVESARARRADLRAHWDGQSTSPPESTSGYLAERWALWVRNDHLTALDRAELRRRGLDEPVSDLRFDLMAHPEFIPYRGQLCGTMGFYFPEAIEILSAHRVRAYFEDGISGGGHCVLDYRVRDGVIEWQLVSAALDEAEP